MWCKCASGDSLLLSLVLMKTAPEGAACRESFGVFDPEGQTPQNDDVEQEIEHHACEPLSDKDADQWREQTKLTAQH